MEEKKEIKENTNSARSEKNFTVTGLLCYFLGSIGAHRFYAGKILTAIFQLLLPILIFLGIIFFKVPIVFLCSLSIWVIIDFILIVTGNFKDKKGLPIKPVDKNQIEEFVTLLFSILSLEFSIAGFMTPIFSFERFFKAYEWIAIILAIIPLFYGITGVIIKNQRGAKLVGFISSIAVLLLASICLVCNSNI